MQIKAVVFDIGNVLVEWQPERFYDVEIGKERRIAMFETVDLHKMNDHVDRGAPFKETIYATADEYAEFGPEIRMWHDRWIEMAQPHIPDSIKLLRALRAKNVPVFALSNFGVGTFEYAETVYPFLKEFDRRYVSGYMRVVKPDPVIYQMVEADCGIAPQHLLFADDRQENLDVAAARGWNTHLFETPIGFANRLMSENLLSESEAGV